MLQNFLSSSSLIRSEFLLTSLNELAMKGISDLFNIEHFSASFVEELPMMRCSAEYIQLHILMKKVSQFKRCNTLVF